MKKYKFPAFIVAVVLVAVIIGRYFLRIKTGTIYGDDLLFFKYHFTFKTLSDYMICIRTDQKLRPVFGIICNSVIGLFGKKMYLYYLFNVGMQTAITFLFALIANLFLRSPILSLLTGMLVGMSRFAFYNITQLCCGGPLEGAAMVFFLLTLYFILKTFVHTDYTQRQNFYALLYSLLAANLAIYTHERYIVLFPFIILVALLYPLKNRLSLQQKAALCLLPALSIALNVFIKVYLLGFHFFVGTGGTQMKFSPSLALGFLKDGLLSIVQVNTGPQYLVGMPYESLSSGDQRLVIAVVIGLISIFVLYLVGLIRSLRGKDKPGMKSMYIILFLFILLFLCMVPAVATIRLEQRWLQASFSVFILILVVAFSNINTGRKTVKSVLLAAFLLLFFYTDYTYLYNGNDHFFIKQTAESTACLFKEAMYNDRIKKDINTLYIDEGHRHENYEIYLGWIIADGYNFDYYQGKPKRIVYIDSLKYTDPEQVAELKNFNRQTDQVIYVREDIIDATDEYLQGRAKFPGGESKQ